jgi:hypothetical protein
MDNASPPESTDPSPMPAPPSLPPWSVIRAVAARASLDPKTVKKRVTGKVVRPKIGARIDAALVEKAREPVLREILRTAAAAAEARIQTAVVAAEARIRTKGSRWSPCTV